MTSLREAAQQALEALEGWENHGRWVWPESAFEQAKRNTTEALAALRAALAEPVQEQPTCDECGRRKADGWALYCVDCLEPMFAQRKPLTEEEIQECFYAARNAKLGSVVVEIARAIERAHGIGG